MVNINPSSICEPRLSLLLIIFNPYDLKMRFHDYRGNGRSKSAIKDHEYKESFTIKPNIDKTHSHVSVLVPEARVPLLTDDATPITDHPSF